MDVENWILWATDRSAHTSRRSRFVTSLDERFPTWESVVSMTGFHQWTGWTHPVTDRSRLDLLLEVSVEDFNAESTAHLLRTAQLEIGMLQKGEALFADTGSFFDYGSIIDDRYEVLGLLGMGGFGIVVKVYSHEVNEFFALKLIRSEFLANHERRAQFIKEASMWLDLGHHLNIAHVEFLDKLKDEMVITMELIEPTPDGLVSLQDHISHRTDISLNEIVSWSVDICRGMTHAYSCGIKAHRDLKPENILISGGTAKVTDFGISGLIQPNLTAQNIAGSEVKIDQTRVGAIMGTLPYMAPEQFLNAHNCNEQSDIYSFGVVLYNLISGGRWPYGNLVKFYKRAEKVSLPISFYSTHQGEDPKRVFHPLFKVAKACLQGSEKNRPKSFAEVEQLIINRVKKKVQLEEKKLQKSYFDPWEAGRKANSLMRLERWEEALEVLDEVLNSLPLTKAKFDKALTLSKLGREEEALDLYAEVLKDEPDHLGALVNTGLIFYGKGELGNAQKYYLKANAQHPDDLAVLTNLGNVAYAVQEYTLAASYYLESVTKDRSYATGWYNLGLASLANDSPNDAKRAFTRFLGVSDPLDSRRKLAEKHT